MKIASGGKKVTIEEAHDLCTKRGVTIHWRPNPNLAEFDESGKRVQYAVAYFN